MSATETEHLLVPMALDVLVLRPEGELLFESAFADPLVADPVVGASATGPAAAPGWGLVNGPAADARSESSCAAAGDPSEMVLSVHTTAVGSSLHHDFLPGGFGPDLAITEVTVEVRRGRLGVGTGDQDRTRADVTVDTGPATVRLRTLNASRPANRLLLKVLSDGGADFVVTRAVVRASETGELLQNPGFEAHADALADAPTVSLTGPEAEVDAGSVATGWTVRHHGAPADARTQVSRTRATRAGASGSALAVTSSGAGSALLQRFLTTGTGPAGGHAGAWLRVTRGTVSIRCGPRAEVVAGTPYDASDWAWVSADSDGAPVDEIALEVTSSGGADYEVDLVSVVPTDGGQLLRNATFDSEGTGPTRLEGTAVAGPSAAPDWSTWNNADSVTTTELRPSPRRPGGAMLHVSTTQPGCGLVQVFLPEHTGPGRVVADAWVRVTRGRVVLGTGDGGSIVVDARSTTTGAWELLTATNGISPANELIVYADSPEGAEYDVDAVRVRGAQSVTPWAECRMAAPDPDGPTVQQLLPAAFAARAPRPPGAYLHWALPDSLTHADQAPATDAVAPAPIFPALPERWVVVRLAAGEPPGRAVRAWVLDGSATPAAPVVTPLESWTAPADSSPPAHPLTALGHGDPGWAAFYDNVEGTLGFYDPVDDAAGPLAYLVCGWYVHHDLDPLTAAAPTTGSTIADLLARWRWTLPEGQVPLGQLPTALLLHGAAVGIAWPERGWPGDAQGALSRELDQRPRPELVRIAFAETISQALTTLAAGADEPSGTRRVIEAFLAQATTEDTGPDGPQRLTAALHATRFDSTSPDAYSETIWQADDPQPMGMGSPDPERSGTSAADGQFTGVARSAPRRYSPSEPTVVLQGLGRSFKHGGDGRFEPDDRLRCRLPGATLTTLGAEAEGTAGLSWTVLQGGVEHDGVPAVCQRLLHELAALDPGSVADTPGDAANAAPASVSPALARTRWWATWDPSNGPVELEADGDLPSPLALTAPSRPWNPLRLDWEVRYAASPGGLRDWTLAEHELAAHQLPAGLAGSPVRGHTLLTPGPATVVVGAQMAATREADGSAAPVGEAAYADLLGCGLEGFHAAVRGDEDGQHVGGAPPAPNPDPTPVRAGVLSLHRLRVVDTYGQVVELVDDIETHGVDPAAVLVPPDAAAPDQPAAIVLPPRYTGPTRVLLRYTAADGSVDAAGRAVEADDTITPVCGYVLTDHVDGSLEVFDAGGAAQGRLRPDPVTGVAWDTPPGLEGAYGERPDRRLSSSALAGFAAGLLDAGTADAVAGQEVDALALFLRLVDAMRSTIDLTSNAGDEHLALILGHPIAVMRADLELEVTEVEAPTTPIEVRLGSLDRLEDGLFGYFVDGDYTRLHLVEPSLAQAAGLLDDLVPHGYLDREPFLLSPGRRVALTLLVQPDCAVHVTTGLLPQKSLGMRRSWVSGSLARLTPSLRYGPVLLPPGQVRLPLPTEIPGTWSWVRRAQPGVWAVDEVTPGLGDTTLPDQPAQVAEGWLRVSLSEASWEQFGVGVTVTSISRPRRAQAGQPLLGVGGTNAAGRSWLLRSDQVADLIRSGRYVFSVQPTADGNPAGVPAGDVVPLQVVTGTDGVDTLTTASAADPVDRLDLLPENGTGIRIWDPHNPATTQVEDPYRRYLLTARHSGRALDVHGSFVTEDGGPVQQFALHGMANQQWQFAWADRSYFTITAWVSGKSLQVAAGSLDEDAQVDQSDDTGADHQRWQAVSTGDGHVVLYARHSGKCLTVLGGPTATGDEVRCVQADYRGLANQQWKLAEVPLAPSLDATVLRLTVPATVAAWQGARAGVTVRNTGNTTWTSQAGHGLLPLDGLAQLGWPWPGASNLLVRDPVPPGSVAVIDGVLVADGDPRLLTGSMTMAVSGSAAFGRRAPSVSVQVVALAPGDVAGADAVLRPDYRLEVVLAGETPNIAAVARNVGSLVWYPEAGYEIGPGAGVDNRLGVGSGTIQGPVNPGDPATTLVAVPGDIAGSYPVVLSVQQRRRGQLVTVSPPGPAFTITVCGLASVTRPDGSPVPRSVRIGSNVTLRVNLNVPAPRQGLQVFVLHGWDIIATLDVPRDAGFVDHTLDHVALPPGVQSYSVLVGGDKWQTQITVTPKGKDVKDKEGGKERLREKIAGREKSQDLAALRRAAPGETDDEADPSSTGAAPWISAEERPDVGEQLYRDDEP